MPKDKPELYTIGEKVRVEVDDGRDESVFYAFGEVVVLMLGSSYKKPTFARPSRVSKLPPWGPKHGEQVYAKIGQSNITRVGTYIAHGPQKGSVLINFEWCYGYIIRPITDDYASVGKLWKDKE